MSFSDSELSKILPTNGPDINEAKKYLNKYKNECICIKIGGWGTHPLTLLWKPVNWFYGFFDVDF